MKANTETSTKLCPKCQSVKLIGDFYRDKQKVDGLTCYCKECIDAAQSALRCTDEFRAKARSKYHSTPPEDRPHSKLRDRFISLYGGRCALCGESEKEFLSLDHVKGGGCAERKTKTVEWAYWNAVSDGAPNFEKYRILCHNCNFALMRVKKQKPFENLTRSTKIVRKRIDAVFTAYGNRCACCGEDNKLCLQLDHVNGGGTEHTKSDCSAAYRDAKKRGFPPDYQLLCANCNQSKHLGKGICMHKREQKTGVAA